MAKRRDRAVGKRQTARSGAHNAKPLTPAHRQAIGFAQQAAGFINAGDLRNAGIAVERGLNLDPENADLLHLGGQVALHLGDIERGIGLIRSAIKARPKAALFHYNLANALTAIGDSDGALQGFRQAVRLNPRDADSFSNMGVLLVQRKQLDDAERAFGEAVRLRPGDFNTLLNLAFCNLQLHRPRKAEEAVRKVEKLVSEPDAEMLHQIGNIYRGLGRSSAARTYYERALRSKPGAHEILYALGDVLSRSGDNRRALEVMQELQAAEYDLEFVNLATARILAKLGQVAEARALLISAADSFHDDPHYLLRIANQLSLIGDFDRQDSILGRVLELDPENVDAFHMRAFVHGRKLEPEEARRLCALAEDRQIGLQTRINIDFSLGNHFRYLKDYDRSYRYYEMGNRLKAMSFDYAGYRSWVETVEQRLTRDYFTERADWGSESRLPLLIVGMPRSGTTLLEQVLSSHPQVHGAGEYGRVSTVCAYSNAPAPSFHRDVDTAFSLDRQAVVQHAAEYLRQMDHLNVKDATLVANKLPHNFEELGLFALLFPRAPVIHIKREPRDNLLSIYFQDFESTHEYAYDQKTLGSYYRLYERLMAHWTSVIPNPVLELQYEDLIVNLPEKARELAAFVGIPFDERMLQFHEHERLVSTASKWQVRQPIYTSSIARWKPYERHLKPLFEALERPAY